LCSAEGWCWENPLPQGLNLNAAFRLDARHTWFVGEAGVVVFFDGEKSSLQAAPVPEGVDLLAVHGTRPDDVFAVGNGGVILHFDGSRWELEGTLPAVTSQLRTVWSLGDGRALAAGAGGVLLSRVLPGAPLARWRVDSFPNVDEIRDVFSAPTGEVYAVTRRSQLFTRPAGSTGNWVLHDTVPLTETYAAIATDGGLTFAGYGPARTSLARRELDGGWRQLTDAGFVTTELFPGEGGMFVFGGNELWWMNDADAFVRLPLQGTAWNTGVAQPGPRLMLAGPQGTVGVMAIDGGLTARGSPRLRPGHALNAVCGSSPGAMYALGGSDCGGCRVRWLERQVTTSGTQWLQKEFQLGSTTQLLACYAEGPGRVWFTGNDSKFITLSSTAQPIYGDFGGGVLYGQYSGAWGSLASGYYFTRRGEPTLTVSDSGVGNFRLLDAGATGDLQSVWGLGKDDVLAVGVAGTAVRFDGVSWTTASNLIPGDFAAVHGARLADGRQRYVAAGNNGALLSVTGDAGTVAQLGAGLSFNASWVSTRGEAWAVGRTPDGGALVMRSELGGAWAREPLTNPRPLTGVFGFELPDGGASVWVTGPAGMVLRKN
ncbi:MAG: hypothetical protein H6Q89_4421, partial [Myxococcaceae bacterium]|nr:hypothetical protein [Myxococcaceae bacterium]